MLVRITLSLLLATLISCAGPVQDLENPAVRLLVKRGNYDQFLCTTAQQIIVNGAPRHFVVQEIRANDTFITEQMGTHPPSKTLIVAALHETDTVNGEDILTSVSCKMINQARANAELGIALSVPRGTCRDVNLLTHTVALAGLSEDERIRYLTQGRKLQFAPDYKANAGGEWLGTRVRDFIKPIAGNPSGDLQVRAPSVQVPWPDNGGDWFEGTHHCKLISLAAMRNWMTAAAFATGSTLFPQATAQACTAPSSPTTRAGSCLMYFGPAGGQFCQDYSGTAWTEPAARADCAIRYRDKAAWDAKSKGKSGAYKGAGGVFSSLGCQARGAASEARDAPISLATAAYAGTCVFRCNTADEALWHVLSPMTSDPEGRMLDRACNLHLVQDWNN